MSRKPKLVDSLIVEVCLVADAEVRNFTESVPYVVGPFLDDLPPWQTLRFVADLAQQCIEGCFTELVQSLASDAVSFS